MEKFIYLLQPCHPEAIQVGQGAVYCHVCQADIVPNFHDFIRNHSFGEDHFRAADLAQAYYEWTGDESVPLPFPVVDVEGIYSKRVTSQPLSNVRETVQLLRAINAPFTAGYICPNKFPEMGAFLTKYMDSIVAHHKPARDGSTEQHVIHELVSGMHQIIQTNEFENPFEFYFTKLVPFTQSCCENWTPLPAMPEEPNLAKEMLIQLQRSSAIRRTFGKYCMSFDVLHAMVASYGCCNDLDMIEKWVLNFMARVCRGEFFWKNYKDCVHVKNMQRLFVTDATFRHDKGMRDTVRQIRAGNAAECLSVFWQHYLKLVASVGEKTDDVVCHQMFPAVLFQSHADFLGFYLATGHVFTSLDRHTGWVPKGTFKKARLLHESVRKFVEEVERFDDEKNVYWDLDMLKMFLVSKDDIAKDVTQFIQMFLEEK
jgi:hypothetical protein